MHVDASYADKLRWKTTVHHKILLVYACDVIPVHSKFSAAKRLQTTYSQGIADFSIKDVIYSRR